MRQVASSMMTMGIDVGGTKIGYALFDDNDQILSHIREQTPQDLSAEALLDHIAGRAQALCDQHNIQLNNLSGIGIGVPCFIRQPEGYIIKSSNIPALREIAAKTYLEQKTGTRIALGNDTHAAGLAESRRGAGRGYESILYCSISSGIASAPILNGNLFLGSYGFAGESGHMLITPDQGEYCPCGKRGCFMSWCSGHMIVKHIQTWIKNGDKTAMLDMVGGDPQKITTHQLKAAYDINDAMAIKAVQQMQKYFALWFFNLYVFMNVNCFVLGGGLIHMGEAFWDEVFSQFSALDDTGGIVHFKPATLGDETGVIGARELLIQR